MNEPVTNNTFKSSKPDIQIDILRWFSLLLSYWWLFLITMIIAVVAGQVYLKYANLKYAASAKLLIKGAGGGNDLSEAGILIEGLGINSGGREIGDEMQILSSRPILEKTVVRIGANVSYHDLDANKDMDLYNTSPVYLKSFKLKQDKKSFSFYVHVDQGGMEFREAPDEKGEQFIASRPIKNAFGDFVIIHNKRVPLSPGTYLVKILSLDHVVSSYKGRLLVEIGGTKSTSSILSLKLIDQSPDKAEDFLNALIDVYNEEDVNDNTEVLRNSIDFIDVRLAGVEGELNEVEGDIQRFKSENKIITQDATSSLGFALAELRASFAELSSYEVEKNVLESLEKELVNDRNRHELIPPNIADVNTSLASLISEYNSLFLQQKKLKETATAASPVILNNESRLQDLKNLIILTIRKLRKDLEIPMKSSLGEINSLKRDMRAIPLVEKRLLEKLRLQQIKEQLYLYLLQRRQETELSIAVTTPNTRTIERARSSGSPVFPRRQLVLLASILLGMFVPIVFVSVLSFFQNTIDSEATLKDLTNIPVVGKIAHNKSKEKIITGHGHRSAISEMFRSLRTNLNYINIGKDKQVMLITSTISGEGKSITALNLGLTIALSGKKIVLVDMDLRKPRVAEYLGKSNTYGVTNFLTGQNNLDEITSAYSENEHFSYITSGPIPPNPSELIMSEKMKTFIEALKKEYDYIILDAPPIGIVADALLFRDYITNTLLVVRHKYTKKEMVKFLNELNDKQELVRPSIIFNDVKKDTVGGSYGQYYGKGYYSDQG